MIINDLTTAPTTILREQPELLERERATAALTGLADNGLYMEDLVNELEALRVAYAGAVVTEIASLRAALNGPLLG